MEQQSYGDAIQVCVQAPLMRHNITGGRGNCVPQDDTEMLSNVEDQTSNKSSTIEIEEVTTREDMTWL